MDILEEIGRGKKTGDESNKWCLETFAYMKKSANLHIQEVEKSKRTNGKRPIMKYIIVKCFKDEGKSWEQKVKKHLNLYMGTSATETMNF